MTTQHTKGPWKTDGRNVLIPVYDTGAGCETVTLMLEKTPGEAKANACLIAAAPELLAALQAIPLGQLTPGQANMVIAAIAKATGAKESK